MCRLKSMLVFCSVFFILSNLTYAQDDEAIIAEYVADTWASFVAMHPADYLFVADGMDEDGILAQNTSPTNIASYIWSTIAARDVSLITNEEAQERIAHELIALQTLERHSPSGQFYNWYSPVDGAVLTTWPHSTNVVCPFLSSVDNAWLAAALMIVTNAIPELASEAEQILDTMQFDFYFDAGAGLFRGGFWPPEMQSTGTGCSAGFTGHHYGVLNSETRIVSYIGIALGQVPPSHYFRLARTFPDTCDWSWQEMKPDGNYITYTVQSSLPIEPETFEKVSVFEGYYVYREMNIVPAWGGGMFEALMSNLLVPEAEWGTQSWAVNHPRFVQAQLEHGLYEAEYGYWGFSPASDPNGGYREYGVDPLGIDASGYTSDTDRTTTDYGFGNCSQRSLQSIPTSEQYITGVVTPHASFLALEFAPEAALNNLSNLRHDFDIYHDTFGFYDSVQTNNGLVARRFLALDQGMIMLASANYLTGGEFKHYFADEIEDRLRPLMQMETFGSFEN